MVNILCNFICGKSDWAISELPNFAYGSANVDLIMRVFSRFENVLFLKAIASAGSYGTPIEDAPGRVHIGPLLDGRTIVRKKGV